MKMKLLSLMFVFVFSATADALDDILTNCTNYCNAKNLSGDDLKDCSLGCYMRRVNEEAEGYSTVFDANPDSMKGSWCPGEIEGDLSTMCD